MLNRNGVSSVKNNLSLIVLLLILMLLLAGMFVYLYSSNMSLKQQVRELKAAQESAPDTSQLTVVPKETEPVSIPEAETEPYVVYDNGTERFDFPQAERALTRLMPSETKTITNDGNRRVVTDPDGYKLTRFGIDVSQRQQVIDWQKVADDGVTFAYIRMGYRGYETGRMMYDPYFIDNFNGASSAGIDTGVYFFSQAVTEAEAEQEADYLLNALSEYGFEPDLPIAFRWEQHPSPGEPARTDDTDGETQTRCAKAFSDRIKSAGYDCLVYTTVNDAFFRYDIDGFDSGLWIADYGDKCSFIYDYAILQYSQSGVIDGIEGFTELDVMVLPADE